MPIPLHDDELEKVDKYDLLMSAYRVNSDGSSKLTQKEYDYYIDRKISKKNMLKDFDMKNIKYSHDFPSYVGPIKQTNIDNNDTNITYICPKYWDVSKNVGIHPRDIYDQLDKIIPQKFKGETEKHIFSKEGSNFREVSELNIKKRIIEYIKNLEIFKLIGNKNKLKEIILNKSDFNKLNNSLEDTLRIVKINKKNKKKDGHFTFEDEVKELIKKGKMKTLKKEIKEIQDKKMDDILALNFKEFNDYIINIIPEIAYNIIHQEIVNSIQPRFFDTTVYEEYKLPCCFNYKEGEEISKKVDKVNLKIDNNLYITKSLAACNFNKFSHIHPKLQRLFNHHPDQLRKRINEPFKEFNEKIPDIHGKFNRPSRFFGGFIRYGVEQGCNALFNTLSNLEHKNNKSSSYEKTMLSIKDFISKGNESLLNYMKLGDGNIVQLFKSEKYISSDIDYFIDNFDTFEDSLKYINMSKDTIKSIKTELNELNISKSSKINIDETYIIIFKSIIKNYNIKLFYDIIISRKNYIKYIESDEIKDYKYIIPLVSALYPNKVYIIFENIDDIINIKLPYNSYNLNEENKNERIFNFIYKSGDVYEPIYHIKDSYYMEENGKPIKDEEGETIFDKDDLKEILFSKINKKDLPNVKSEFSNHIFKDKQLLSIKDTDYVVYYMMNSNIKNNLYPDEDINEYINSILDGITNNIKGINNSKYENINLFELDDLLGYLHKDPDNNTGIKLLVDNYCKISHVITNKKHIYPIIPGGVINSFNIKQDNGENKNYKYELIYSFKKNTPTYDEYIKYSKTCPGIIRSKFSKLAGCIINNKEEVINIILNTSFKSNKIPCNNAYIPIQPIKYNKKTHKKILGYKNIYEIDKDLSNFKQCNDIQKTYNTNIDYIKHITNLMIQNIIFYIKNKYSKYKSFCTNNHSDYVKDKIYTFKKIPNNVYNNLIEINTDLIDYYYEPNKFKGIVRKIGNANKSKPTELTIDISILDELYLKINNSIKINYDKQDEIFNYIKGFIDEIVVVLPDKEYKEYKENKNVSICFDNESSECDYPCFSDNDNCKLYVKKSSIYDKKSLINKIIWKFVDLLLIHKNIDIVKNILQDNININDLYKTVKSDEIYFDYSQYINKYLDDLFKYESKYIRNINFYDQFNINSISSNEPKPITSILKGVPNIIRQLFKSECNILTYMDENNLDFIPICRAFHDILKEEIDSIKFKEDIKNYMNKKLSENPEYIKKILLPYHIYDNQFFLDKLNNKLTNKQNKKIYGLKQLDIIKEYIDNKSYKLLPSDLEILSKKYENVGFLLITSKYSEQDPSKLKHNIEFKYNSKTINKDTNIILLYHYLNENNKYDMANIIIKTNPDDEDSYKTFLSLEKIYNINKIKTIINKDYPEVGKLFIISKDD